MFATLEDQIANVAARLEALYQAHESTCTLLNEALRDIAHLKASQQQPRRGPGRPPKTTEPQA